MAFTDKNAEPYSGEHLVRYIQKAIRVSPPNSKIRHFSYQIIKRMLQTTPCTQLTALLSDYRC
jgi:hypothetical protein